MSDCTKCANRAAGRLERFVYTWRGGREQHWDITLARAFVEEEPRLPRAMSLEDIALVLTNYDGGVEENHLAHVPLDEPGIAIETMFEGRLVCLLIDGYHRAAACLKAGRMFGAYLLTKDEARACERMVGMVGMTEGGNGDGQPVEPGGAQGPTPEAGPRSE